MPLALSRCVTNVFALLRLLTVLDDACPGST